MSSNHSIAAANNKQFLEPRSIQPATVLTRAATSVPSLTPNLAEISRAIAVMFAENQTVELRALGAQTCVGFYRDRAKLAADAAKLSANPATSAVYCTLQEIDPELFNRAPNRYHTHVRSGVATKDENVPRYRELLIDCDPLRKPAKISSTDTEKADALEVATTVREYFSLINGFDGYESILADSGNGYHVLLRIDLPVTAESKRLYARVLQALGEQFSTGDKNSGTKIDTGVFNPSRVCKIYGTVVRKGPDTEERPHRLSRLLEVPDSLPVVPVEVLERIAAKVEPLATNFATGIGETASQETLEDRSIKMEQFLAESKFNHRSRMDYDNGGFKWQLEACPFNPEHKAPDSYAFIRADGKWGFNCSHNSCKENKWNQFRDKAESIIGHKFQFRAVQERMPDYARTGSSSCGKAVHPILLKAREASLQFDMNQLVFNPTAEREIHEPILDGFLIVGDFALWIGAKKTEKSLFALRIGMHVACGKDWCGYKCTKLRKIAYLDAENGGATISERYDELLKEFTAEEQELIQANFKIVDGRKYRDAGGSLDYLKDVFWNWYAKESADAEIHILDCLYMFHDKDPKDNVGLLEVIDMLRYRLVEGSSGRTVIMLNHTRSLSNDDLKKVNSLSLERLGAQNFSEQSYGGKVLLKNATMVMCFDKQSKRDEDGEEIETTIYLQFYGRKVQDSPLIKFEPENEKYRRRLIRDLSKGGKKAAIDLRMARGDSGSWESKHEAAKDVKCARSNAYRHLSELIVKGYLVEDDQGVLHLHVTNELAREIGCAEQKSEAQVAAREWLRTYLTRPMEAENVIDVGDENGHNRDDLTQARKDLKFVQEERLVGEGMPGVLIWRPRKKPGLANRKDLAADLSKRAHAARWNHNGDEPEEDESQSEVSNTPPSSIDRLF